ncbi:IS3 family transposase, partial [Listeria sp. SHR_NRA_18]
SNKGCPYDNAVAESTYKSFKKEFVYPNKFQTLNQLKVQLLDYVNWWNHIRLHGTLNYQSPVSFRIAKSVENIGVFT